MTLLEAIQTDRKIRRKGSKSFVSSDSLFLLAKEDIEATDWEVEPEPEKSVTITRRDLFRAARLANYDPMIEGVIRRDQAELLANALGL